MTTDKLLALNGRDIPMIAIRSTLIFPGERMTFTIGREFGVKAVEAAMEGEQKVLVVGQKDSFVEDPKTRDVYPMGTIADVELILDAEDDSLNVSVMGLARATFEPFRETDQGYYTAQVTIREPFTLPDEDRMHMEMQKNLMLRLFQRLAVATGEVPADNVWLAQQTEDMDEVLDLVASSLDLDIAERYDLLSCLDRMERIERLISLMHTEIEIWGINKDISQSVERTLEKNQRRYLIREQIRALEAELGDKSTNPETDALFERLEKSLMPEEDKKKVAKEIRRLSRMPESYPEALVQRNWVELLLDLPFGRMNKERVNLKEARKVLDRDHYGLEKVKERILEYIAVRRLKIAAGETAVKGPILCLVGPPGVGKTSIAKSIAEALGRKYERMSLGGVRDEAEIRGHRRTYVGALPGRIIQAIRNADTDNPLILLDEVDKLGNDFRGDPSSALLEVLDPEQNDNFRDHYVELKYDLSHVLFVTTANDRDGIPEPLLDRMELIELSGYTEEEKLEIGRRHLMPKQIAANGLTKDDVSLTEGAYRHLIQGHTREAGVRQLERELARICRRVAVKKAEDGDEASYRITVHNLDEFTGNPKFSFEKAQKQPEIGQATGLAWTSAGGDTLTIEINDYPGTGKLVLTGRLGDVMKESAQAALTYVRSRADELGIDPEIFQKTDIHVHVPAGAVPKDGPSAGITLATALASALTGRPVRSDLAMTGEVTLRGRVLPIGGLKEKTVAANRAKIKEVLIPKENEREVEEEVPETVRKSLKIRAVDHMDEVLDIALLDKPDAEAK